jgi:hypothetical protein
MKEAIVPAIVIFLAVISFSTWLGMAYWTAQFAGVRSRVITELKPFMPSIEKELGFWTNPKNQNTFPPSLLRELVTGHELSEKLSSRTRNALAAALKGLLWWRRAFLFSWLTGVILFPMCGIMIVILTAFFPDVLK